MKTINKNFIIDSIKTIIKLNDILHSDNMKEVIQSHFLNSNNITIDSIIINKDSININYYNHIGQLLIYRISINNFIQFISNL